MTMDPEQVAALVRKAIPDAKVEVSDMTGAGDHFIISVISSVFGGKMLIDQHRIVQQSLAEAMADGRIHAVQIKTQTPGHIEKSSSQDEGLNIIN